MKILLVDDHAVVRAGFRRILEDEIAGVAVGEASNAGEAVDRLRTHKWDVVVLDLSLPGRGGLELIQAIHKVQPRLPVLILTMYPEEQYGLRAFRAGAAGYITKNSPPEEILGAIHKVHRGGKYVSPAMAEVLAATLAEDQARPLHDQLSDRELQVLRRIAAGRSLKEIGFELGLSEKTVGTYRHRILEKLKVRTTADLIRYAIRAQLVE